MFYKQSLQIFSLFILSFILILGSNNLNSYPGMESKESKDISDESIAEDSNEDLPPENLEEWYSLILRHYNNFHWSGSTVKGIELHNSDSTIFLNVETLKGLQLSVTLSSSFAVSRSKISVLVDNNCPNFVKIGPRDSKYEANFLPLGLKKIPF